MLKYSTLAINNRILSALEDGLSNSDAFDIFLMMKKANDKGMEKDFEDYLNEWEGVLQKAAKKKKSRRMAKLAIKAAFSEAMKDYPQIKYEFFEQCRRVRIKVKFPDNNLGIYIDAWLGSYKKELPGKIEDMKELYEFLRDNKITTFFISHKK